MNKRTFKKAVRWTGASLLLLLIVLAVHIYMVTRPKIDASTRIMARIDLHRNITTEQAEKITFWLYKQKGVDHVMVNDQSAIAIFTYAPIQADANKITADLAANFSYPEARRYVPSENELKGGCPVASGSVVYKVSKAMQNLFN